jgi:ADP-heptose:LPS heptosyltransferase
VSPLYSLLSRVFPTRRPLTTVPRRVVLILPCCIGDVVLGTAVLHALKRAYPDAHITWAVGSWSRDAIVRHPDLNGMLDTGHAALPVKSPGNFWRFVRQLRGGDFDLAVSLIRSPLMSLAVGLSGIPSRAGVDSGGRGFGYNVRVAVDPAAERHEAEIYLDVARALGVDTEGCYAYTPPHADNLAAAQAAVASFNIEGPFAVINPAGGSNPGMVLDAKRYPPHGLGVIARGLQANGLRVIVTAGPNDGLLIEALQREMDTPLPALVGKLTLSQIGALASLARVYIGNDTGLTHLAAASGAKTVMLMGPSSPKRYAPFTPDSLALWKRADIPVEGVVYGAPRDWIWSRDGIAPEDALAAILRFIG